MKIIKVKGQEIIIRNYRKEDEKQVRELCCDTGFLGEPIDILFDDREWFADLNTKYYLKFEPNSSFVAEADGKLVGYVLGCKNHTNYFFIFYFLIAIPLFIKALFKCIIRSYHLKNRKFIYSLITNGIKERPKRPKKSAHLHINIKNGFRGSGIGRALVETLFHYFLNNGVKKVYGELTFVENKQTEELYTKHGFIIYDKRPTKIWGEETGKTYLMTILMDLEEWQKTQKII